MRKNRKAQATLEISFALIATFLLLFAVMGIFVWINYSLFERQWLYEDPCSSMMGCWSDSWREGRVKAGKKDWYNNHMNDLVIYDGRQIDESRVPDLELID